MLPECNNSIRKNIENFILVGMLLGTGKNYSNRYQINDIFLTAADIKKKERNESERT